MVDLCDLMMAMMAMMVMVVDGVGVDDGCYNTLYFDRLRILPGGQNIISKR